ncbi:MAG: small GTP-binding protein [Promethearchaeota archaeon CR_4]|nr:MAG: small GTP-binding protein [Candidatus Lokiarchaeota archaeon CR_4]
MDDFMDYAYKVIIAGDGGVGKTTLLRRIATQNYDPQSLTIGLNHEEWLISEKSDVIHLICWDLGGQEQFQMIHHTYSTGTHGYIFAYDCTRPSTLWNIPLWIENLKQGQPKIEEIPKILIGTKYDLGSQIETTVIAEFIDEHHFLSHYLTSAKTGLNIKDLLDNFGRIIHKNYQGKWID